MTDFKIGDRVRVKPNNNRIGKILSMDIDEGSVKVRFNDETTCCCRFYQLELVEPINQQDNFKVGDRVRSLITNTIGEIASINLRMARIKPLELDSSEDFWLNFNDMELFDVKPFIHEKPVCKTHNPVNPEHYPNAGTSNDLIGHWLSIGWESAIAANIQKYTERAVTLKGEDKLKSLRKAQEYNRRWIEFVEGKDV